MEEANRMVRLGFVVYFGFSLLDYRVFLKYAHIVYGVSLYHFAFSFWWSRDLWCQ